MALLSPCFDRMVCTEELWGSIHSETILRGERIHVQTDVGGQANPL